MAQSRYDQKVAGRKPKTEKVQKGGVSPWIAIILWALIGVVLFKGYLMITQPKVDTVDFYVITYDKQESEVIHKSTVPMEMLEAINDVYDNSPDGIDMGRWSENSYFFATYIDTKWEDFVKDSGTQNLKYTEITRDAFMKKYDIDSFDVMY